jgi:hypothetical protein
VPDGAELIADCNLASTVQRSFKALDAKSSTSGKGISLLYYFDRRLPFLSLQQAHSLVCEITPGRHHWSVNQSTHARAFSLAQICDYYLQPEVQKGPSPKDGLGVYASPAISASDRCESINSAGIGG